MRLIARVLVAAALFVGPASAQTPPPAPASPPGPLLTAQSFARYQRATEVEVRNVAGFVRVRPENRNDVSIALINSGPLPGPSVRTSGNKLIIDGGMRNQIAGCAIQGATGFEVRTRRNGRVGTEHLQTIELRVPQNVVLSVGGAARLRVGRSERLTVRIDGCGDADIQRVDGPATLAVAGSPDVRLYEAAELEASLASAGDIVVGLIHNGLTVSIAGSGDFVAARADGPMNIAIQGSGDVLIREGRATALSVAIAGSGDVTHNGSAERLDAAIFGSGDVHVRRVDGEVNRRVIGGGEVTIGR